MRAKKPDLTSVDRLKCMLLGKSGVGKTISALRLFPRAVVIDAERGCDDLGYRQLIADQGSVLLQTSEYDEVYDELWSLATTEHEFRTVIIDPISTIYQSIQDSKTDIFRKRSIAAGKHLQAALEEFGFGYWYQVKRGMKRLTTLMTRVDMNVIVIAHEKTEYAQGDPPRAIGVTFDSIKDHDYFFDYIFRMFLEGERRMIEVRKQRSYPEQRFQRVFEFSEDYIRDAWGEGFSRKATPIQVATPGQVAELCRLIEVIKLPDETVQKWLDKEGVEDWEEFSQVSIAKCIKHLKDKISESA